MKKVRSIIVVLVVIIFTFTSVFAVTPENSPGVSQSTKQSDQISRFIVKYKDSSQSGQLGEKLKNELKKNKKFKNNFEMLETKTEITVDELMTEIENVGLKDTIEYVQEDTIIKAFEEGTAQDENLTVTEKVYGGSEALVYPGLEQVWGLTTGENVAVGIIDTGIDINHEDLKNNIWANSDEIPGDGIDEDGNGYADDVNGWNFAGDNNDVYDENDSTDEEHGTAIAGIIAAEKDNGVGIAGVAPKAKVMLLKVFKDGQAYTSGIIEAIEYAKVSGVKVINCSWGTGEENQALKDAMADSGMLFICAVGNSGADLQQNPVYPACFGLSNIISVASINSNGSLSSFSNYSSSLTDIAAPGEEVVSTIPGNEYSRKSGTSIAAAYVSGEAALVMSKYKEATAQEVKNRITGSADKAAALESKVKGGSRINYLAAVTGKGMTPVSETNSGTVADTVYGDEYGFSLMSMEEGYSAPQDVSAQVISLPANTANGQMKMSILGNTRTNINPPFTKWISMPGTIISERKIQMESQTYDMDAHTDFIGNIDPDKKYILVGKTNISTSGVYIDVLCFDIDKKVIMDSRGIGFSNLKKEILTLPQNTCYVMVRCIVESYAAAGIYEFEEIGLYELESGDESLPESQLLEKYSYVDGTKSTSALRIKSVGKNIIPSFTDSRWVHNAPTVKIISANELEYSTTNNWQDSSIDIPVIPNTTYTMSCDGTGYVDGNTRFPYVHIFSLDNEKNRVKGILGLPITNQRVSGSFTTDSDTEFIRVYLTNMGASTFRFIQPQLENGNISTAYEPNYESNYYIPDGIELNSLPNGVKDEINLEKGIYINRIDVASDGTLTQLAQPQVSSINTQPLTCYEKGTIIVERAAKGTSNYSTGIFIKNANLPIKEIESIYRIDGTMRIPVSTSSAAIASDGLSFTITGAQNGDTYEYTYRYADELSTLPTIRYSVPTDSTSQSNGNTEAINLLQAKVDNLEQRIKALEDLIKNGIGSKTIEFQYDANGNLQAIIAK